MGISHLCYRNIYSINVLWQVQNQNHLGISHFFEISIELKVATPHFPWKMGISHFPWLLKSSDKSSDKQER